MPASYSLMVCGFSLIICASWACGRGEGRAGARGQALVSYSRPLSAVGR